MSNPPNDPNDSKKIKKTLVAGAVPPPLPPPVPPAKPLYEQETQMNPSAEVEAETEALGGGGEDNWVISFNQDGSHVESKVASTSGISDSKIGQRVIDGGKQKFGSVTPGATEPGFPQGEDVFAPGTMVYKYEIIKLLGRGGMGAVYVAHDTKLGRKVAIKFLNKKISGKSKFRQRFMVEAQATAKLNHENVVTIYDVGEFQGASYLVLEYLEGSPLTKIIKGRKIPVPQALHYIIPVARALGAAHAKGIIHRDLKPDNIFLLKDPSQPGALRSKLFDFGVAKLLGEQEKQVGHKTMAGAVVGTPFYMSPEQALCQDVTAASDIYSMGVVMFEMATGSVPFHAEQLVILLNAILKEPATPPSELRPEIPPFLDRLILRCLEKIPGSRPQSMKEVIALLDAGAAESANSAMAVGETMLATPAQVVSRPSSSAALAATLVPQAPRTSVPRMRATNASQASTSRANGAPRTITAVPDAGPGATPAAASHTGSARRGGPGLLAMVRGWLNSPRIRRAAIPTIITAAGVVVASVFMSHASAPSVTAEVVAEQPPPLPVVQHAAVTLASEPSGAEVTRLNDGRLLGTTPVVDIRPLNDQPINYRFRLAGYTEVQIPFLASTGGNFEIKATLEPKGREPGRSAHVNASSRPGKGKARGKKTEPTIQTPVVTQIPAPAPTARVAPNALEPSILPPLNPSVRVRRIGGR